MFTQTFLDDHAYDRRARRPFPMVASLAIQTTALLALLVVPMLRSLRLSADDLRVRPPQPAFTRIALQPVPVPSAQTAPNLKAVRSAFPHALIAPSRIPRTVSMQAMDEYLQTGNDPVNTSGMGTAADTVLPALTLPGPLGRSTSAAVPTPQREPQKPVAHPIVVGTGVQAAKLLVAPKPAYPPLARAARVQGTVRLRALVATTGEIKNLQLISGPPLLVSAAYNAVTQWRYKPTLLNGEPVEVMTEIDVNFTLSQ